VQAGIKRKYVDNSSVLKLKNKLNRRAEVQLSIINYRKGGQPFMNLLTMIPVTWDTDEFKYYVGFQVDLVEQPSSVQAKNPGMYGPPLTSRPRLTLMWPDGSYAINYQRGGQFPRYVLQTPDTTLQTDMGQTIGREEVSAVLTTLGAGESDLSKRIWDKVLLENTDDVVHVLSLKGLFLYLSPASRKVLEYDASELVGTALSSVCHPSDIVPVTRELKDTSGGAAVNVVFRIRRKHSGYTWFESYGCLHTEQGKGRKCIILVGRQRPVYALARSEITSDGGIGENELWTKMSTSGMFLFVSSNARTLLDRTPEDLIGTSIQALMRADSKREFNSALEVARTGQKMTVKHDLQTRRGQVLQAQTAIFPGDAEPGQKPTFFVGQTKFVKMTRALLLSQKPEAVTSPRIDRAPAGPAASSAPGGAGKQPLSRSASTSQSFHSVSPESTVFATKAGGDGLMIGNQDEALASEDNIFDELKTTRSTSWQFELRQMEKQNRLLAEELQGLLTRRKKRKRRKGLGQMEKDCANCHTRVTPEWRRGPSGNRDLCNSCGLRWAKQVGSQASRQSSLTLD
jgi:PAS domain-containing protein